MTTTSMSRITERVWPDAAHPRWLEETLLRSGQVAQLFQVSRRTIADWAQTGKIEWIETPGGHRRFRASHVRALLESMRVFPRG